MSLQSRVVTESPVPRLNILPRLRGHASAATRPLYAKRSSSLLAPEPEVSERKVEQSQLPPWDELLPFPEQMDRASSGQRASTSASQPDPEAQHSWTRQESPESLLFLAGHDLAHLKALLPARWYHFLQLKCCLTSSGAQLQAAETYLKEVCGLTHSQAAVVLDSAMAWRYKHGGPTPGEMKLHQACYRNLVRVAEALQQDCGVPPGTGGLGAIFERVPPLLWARPRQTDKWDLRIVQLAAFHHTHRHCRVPPDYEGTPGLGAWAARQKVARQGGRLSPARLELLQALKFDFGQRMEVTKMWEREFDQLLDWFLVKGEEIGSRLTWLGLEWGPLGGVRARRAALWVQMQRAAYKQGFLPAKATQRLEIMGMCWESMGGLEKERCWMDMLGRLALAVHVKRQEQLYSPEAEAADSASINLATAMREAESPLQQEDSHPGTLEDWLPMSEKDAVQLHADWGARCRAADELQPDDLEDSVAEWLVAQRAAWQAGRLDLEQRLLLQMAGIRSRVVPQWQARLQGRLSSSQSQTSQKRTQWLSSVDEDQDIITQDLITQLPQAPAQSPAAEAGSDEEAAGLDRSSPQGAAKLQQLQGVLAYAAVMPWQQPAGSVRVAALVQASSMLLITMEDLAVGSPALAVGIGWLIWLWLQIIMALGQNAISQVTAGEADELEPKA